MSAELITCFSTNGEDFVYSDASDALDALASDGELEVGRIYYECDFKRIEHSYALNAGEILDRADEIIFEEVGETADEQFTAVTPEAKAELQALLTGWAEKWVGPINGYLFVGPVRELVVTEDDVASHGGAA